MQVRQAPDVSALRPQAKKPPAEQPADGYNGPADGLSHLDEKAAPRIRTALKTAMYFAEKVEVEGEQRIPAAGSHLLAINHQTYFDAPTMAVASPKAVRYMAARDQFQGIVGQAMTAMGTFPVDQSHPLQALETSIKLLDQDLCVGIYPQGRLMGETNEIKDYKEGAAMVAIKSKCDSLVPVSIHYTHPPATLVGMTGAYAAGAVVTAAGIACAALGGPAARAISGVLTGAVGGALVAGAIGSATAKEKDIKNMALGFVGAAWKGALVGSAAGGLNGLALGGSLWIAGPLSGLAGFTTLAIGRQVAGRQVAHVSVGDPIAVGPYRQMEDKKAARARLTADLQAAVTTLKQAQIAAFGSTGGLG